MQILTEDLSLKNKWFWIDVVYLFIIAATAGAILTLGAFSAPVIFHIKELTHYQEGVVMAEIFRRFGYWLYFTLFAIILYEGYRFKILKRDNIITATVGVVIFTTLMFTVVYTPAILQMQALGEAATQSKEFSNIHKASEIDFQLLLAALVVLFVRRYYRITHPMR